MQETGRRKKRKDSSGCNRASLHLRCSRDNWRGGRLSRLSLLGSCRCNFGFSGRSRSFSRRVLKGSNRCGFVDLWWVLVNLCRVGDLILRFRLEKSTYTGRKATSNLRGLDLVFFLLISGQTRLSQLIYQKYYTFFSSFFSSFGSSFFSSFTSSLAGSAEVAASSAGAGAASLK